MASLAVEHPLAAKVDEIAVIAGIFNNPTLVYFNDAVHDPIKEPPIMADHQNGAGILIRKEIL